MVMTCPQIPHVGCYEFNPSSELWQSAKRRRRFPLLHFKDFAFLNPPVIEFGTDRQKQIVDLGQGLVPFKQYVAEAKKIGGERYIVDYDPPFKNQTALEAAKFDVDYLSGLLSS